MRMENSKGNILWVDDEIELLRAHVVLLRDKGYAVETATNGEDAIEMLLAGASLIGIGTGIAYRGEKIFKLVCDEMRAWGKSEGVKDIKELIGGMHKRLAGSK